MTKKHQCINHPKYHAEYWFKPIEGKTYIEFHAEIWRKDGVPVSQEETESIEYRELLYFLQMDGYHWIEFGEIKSNRILEW